MGSQHAKGIDASEQIDSLDIQVRVVGCTGNGETGVTMQVGLKIEVTDAAPTSSPPRITAPSPFPSHQERTKRHKYR